MIYFSKKGNALFQKPDKILLANPNLFQVLCHSSNTGSLRESFFVSMMQSHHVRYLKKRGDYVVDDRWVFEIGGKGKDFRQVEQTGYLALADMELGEDRKIPFWLFGFLY
jgi:predicted AAA+ superfamily ATPase